MKKQLHFILLCYLFAFCLACKQAGQSLPSKDDSSLPHAPSKQSPPSNSGADTLITPNAPARITRKIRTDRQGNLLFAAYDKVIKYDGKSFSPTPPAAGFEHFDAFDAYEDSKGNLWIASTHFGLFKYDGKTYTHFTRQEGLIHDRTMCIEEDKTGLLWIGTEGGISCYDGKTFRNFTSKDGLTGNSINTILEDQSGKIWVGTRGTLCVYEPSSSSGSDQIAFSEYVSKEGKTFENVWSIVEDQRGDFWLGGEHGIWRIQDASARLMTPGSVNGLYEDRRGNIWFTHQTAAAHQAGLSYFDTDLMLDQKPKAVPIFTGKGMFFGMAEDAVGRIWVGTLNGAFFYKDKTIVYLKDQSGKD